MSKKPQMVTRKVKEPVKYFFSQEEIVELAKELSQTSRRLQELAAEAKQVANSYKAKISEAESRVMINSNLINDGWETRTMECVVTMNTPKAGRKTITRGDTGEIVREASMDPDDMQAKLSDAHMLPEEGSDDCNGDNAHIPDED